MAGNKRVYECLDMASGQYRMMSEPEKNEMKMRYDRNISAGTSLYEYNNRGMLLEKMEKGHVMSFVGIIKNGQAMAVFGDTKITDVDVKHGDFSAGGEMRKVFRSRRMLLAFYDEANAGSLDERRDDLDRVIASILRRHPWAAPEKFVRLFRKKIRSRKVFRFIIGTKGRDGYEIKEYSTGFMGGFRSANDAALVTNMPFIDLSGFEERAEGLGLEGLMGLGAEMVQHVHDVLEENGGYNAVGGHICVEGRGKEGSRGECFKFEMKKPFMKSGSPDGPSL